MLLLVHVSACVAQLFNAFCIYYLLNFCYSFANLKFYVLAEGPEHIPEAWAVAPRAPVKGSQECPFHHIILSKIRYWNILKYIPAINGTRAWSLKGVTWCPTEESCPLSLRLPKPLCAFFLEFKCEHTKTALFAVAFYSISFTTTFFSLECFYALLCNHHQ